MAAPSMHAQRWEGVRANPRLKVFKPATLRVAGGEMRVHLLDVSRSGALGHAAAPPAPMARVILACSGWEAVGRIAWVDGQRFGIAFDLPLSDAVLARALQGGD